MISRRPYLLLLLLALLSACSNDLPIDPSGQDTRIQFPTSLTLEKILGVTWKVDREKQEVILPKLLSDLSVNARPILNVAGKHLNSLYLSKTGQVYATYIIEEYGNTIFYYTGTWTLDPKAPEELLVRVGSPIGGDLEYRLKVRRFNLLNNMLTMEAFFVNPDYSFSALMTGKGAQDDYWSKETDVIDPSWSERNPISQAPIDYRTILGSYRVDLETWKRVLYIDDALYNVYPLLTFPLFPFRGDTDHYAGTFEIDVIPPIATTYARHDASIIMELVRDEEEALLVRFSEPGMITAYVTLHKVKTK